MMFVISSNPSCALGRFKEISNRHNDTKQTPQLGGVQPHFITDCRASVTSEFWHCFFYKHVGLNVSRKQPPVFTAVSNCTRWYCYNAQPWFFFWGGVIWGQTCLFCSCPMSNEKQSTNQAGIFPLNELIKTLFKYSSKLLSIPPLDHLICCFRFQ